MSMESHVGSGELLLKKSLIDELSRFSNIPPYRCFNVELDTFTVK